MIVRRCLICNPIHDMVRDEAGEWVCIFHGKVDDRWKYEDVERPDTASPVTVAIEVDATPDVHPESEHIEAPAQEGVQ